MSYKVMRGMVFGWWVMRYQSVIIQTGSNAEKLRGNPILNGPPEGVHNTQNT